MWSFGRLTQKPLWVRNGPGPELSSPHTLFEVTYDGAPQGWLSDAAACSLILGLLENDFGAEPAGAFEGRDVFSAFGNLVLLLQKRAGIPVSEVSVLTRAEGTAWVAVEHLSSPAAQMAGALALQFMEIMGGVRIASAADLLGAIVNYEQKAASSSFDHKILYAEARRRGIPVTITPPTSLSFGQGKHRRRLSGKTTDRTPQLAVRLSSNKSATIEALGNAGLPVPRHIPVRDAAEARAAAGAIGFPLVVKPTDTDQGVGVTVGVRSNAELDAAYRTARQFSDRVSVEQFLPGDTFRLLVIGGSFVAACRTQPTPIVGDGTRSIRQIVTRINMSPLRGPGHQKPLSWIDFDEEAMGLLKAQGLTPDSILPFGRTIRLRTASNLSKGGESVSVNDIVHPDNRMLAELCARIIGLDIMGIDFRSEAIERSWKEGGCGIIEVNPNPGLRMHLRPARGPAADIASPILDLLFPGNSRTRIPIVAVTGTNGKTTTTRLIAHMLRASGLSVGSTTTDEVMIDGRVITEGDSAGPGPARRVLSVPTVDAAVLETARGGIIKYGLGFERCDVAVITNVTMDHIGELGVRTVDELASVKATVARAADRLVINADDPHCLKIRAAMPDKPAILFSMHPDSPAVYRHVEAGGVAYVLSAAESRETILRKEEGRSEALFAVDDIPITFGGAARFNVENAMAALAAMDALGMDVEDACGAAMSFRPDTACNPGRLNPVPGFPFEVLLDHAHNEPGFAAVAEFVSRRPCAGKRHCIVSMNGSRIPDEAGAMAMRPLASCFDVFYTCSSGAPHKRRQDLPAALAEGLSRAGAPAGAVTVCGDQCDAIRLAVKAAGPGDLLVVLYVHDAKVVADFLGTLAAAGRAAAAPR